MAVPGAGIPLMAAYCHRCGGVGFVPWPHPNCPVDACPVCAASAEADFVVFRLPPSAADADVPA